MLTVEAICYFSSSFSVKTLSVLYYYHYSGAAGALTAMIIKRLGYAEKHWSLLFTINGGLTGMVKPFFMTISIFSTLIGEKIDVFA